MLSDCSRKQNMYENSIISLIKFESLIPWLDIKEINKNFVDILKFGTKNKKDILI